MKTSPPGLGPTISLLQIAMSLSPGQAIDIDEAKLRAAAIDDLPALDRMGGCRESDLKEFIAKVSENWGVQFREKMGQGKWQMYKP